MQCCGSGSGIQCFFYPCIRDPGWVKNQDPDLGFGSELNIPDHISESLNTIFWGKILKFFDGSGIKKFGSGIRDGKKSDPGSGMCNNTDKMFISVSRRWERA
jgi:hypothetical protein